MRTRAVHAGEPRPLIGEAIVAPIFQSSTYRQVDDSSYHDIRYLRLNNTPNHLHVGAKIADLEGTEAAIPTSSGMSAITTALLALLESGDHIIVQDCVYGGTLEFFLQAPKAYGIDVTFVSLDDPDAWRAARLDRTRALYTESVTNPLIDVGRLDEIVAFGREHGYTTFIDNTFPSPCNFRPVDLGFDVILHSATKYLNGHSDLVGGAVAGRRETVERVRDRLNVLGGSMDPHTCYLLGRGMKTLPLRVAAQNQTAQQLAEMLARHPAVETVRYPGLAADPSHERAARWFDGFGGMLSFVPAGGLQHSDRVLAALALPIRAPSLGGVETLVSRPATSSHAGLEPGHRRSLGIADAMIRVSVGIEDADDLVADFAQALDTGASE